MSGNLPKEDQCRLHLVNGHRVVTAYDVKPIPIRNMDWFATLEDYDGAWDTRGPNSCIGMGTTEQDAIDDLLELLEEWP